MSSIKTDLKIHIIAVAFQRIGELKVFVQSLLNQSNNSWTLTIIHDGPNSEFDSAMHYYKDLAKGQIESFSTEKRYNDYGHSLREIGLKNVKSEYVLLTNADNYFIPKTIEYLIAALNENQADVVMFDMIHSHNNPGGRKLPPYSFFKTDYARGSIDVSAAIVKRELAEKAGFRDKTHDGDASYFEDVVRVNDGECISILKIPRVLLVHN